MSLRTVMFVLLFLLLPGSAVSLSQSEEKLSNKFMNKNLFDNFSSLCDSETALPDNSKNNSTNMTVRNDILMGCFLCNFRV